VQDVQTTLPAGSVIRDRYTVEDLLGKGGFGAVYLVQDQRVRGNLFALKEVIDPNKEERMRFAFECEVLKRLDNPALPRVYRVFEDNKNIRVYMLMDYIAGPNLEILRQRQPEKRFSLSQAMRMMSPIVGAVSYLHRQRPPIIHRDIKPANIIVPDAGDEAVLVDFGIAKEYDQDSTTTAVRRCSPGYGAPEQYAKGTNPRTDIYGLGATFYAILTGTIPADALYRMTQMGSKSIDPLESVQQLAPDVPQHVSDAVHRAMSINSNDRFATVEEFWQALNTQPVVEPPLAVASVAAPQPVALQQVHAVEPAPVATPNISDVPTTVYRQVQPTTTRKRRIIPALIVMFALLALLAGVAFGTGFFSRASNFGSIPTTPVGQKRPVHAASTATTTPQSKPTTTNPTPVATATTPAQPTPPPTNAPTAPSSNYPILTGPYNGTVTDKLTSPATIANLSLSPLNQNGSAISGFATISLPLQGSGSFTGTVSTNKAVQFTVAAYATNLPLFFTGNIQPNGGISGTYCAIQNGQCNNNEGHGDWQVAPRSPTSFTAPQGGPYSFPNLANGNTESYNKDDYSLV